MDAAPVALVTGGTRGIGLGIARCLAQEGWGLALCGRRAASEVERELTALRALTTDILYVPADVSEPSARAALLAAVRARFGRLHALVNNAGIAPRVRADLLEAREDSFAEVMRTNLQGPFFLTQAVARWLIAQRQADPEMPACIVNVSSISASVASPSRGEYCLSKAALSMATKLWAVRLAEFGIPVYEVRPGLIETDMTATVHQRYDRLIAEGAVLQRRWGQPEDVGRAVAMLLQGRLSYSTGQVLVLDGGLTLARL
ncbi:MAG: 3-ketoacyl-ACP reductase [Anaerolineae bacterium]